MTSSLRWIVHRSLRKVTPSIDSHSGSSIVRPSNPCDTQRSLSYIVRSSIVLHAAAAVTKPAVHALLENLQFAGPTDKARLQAPPIEATVVPKLLLALRFKCRGTFASFTIIIIPGRSFYTAIKYNEELPNESKNN